MAREGELLLDDAGLVLALEEKAHHGVVEEFVVERLQDRAHSLLAADRLVEPLHRKWTSAPASSFTMRAMVAKSSSPRPLSSSQRPAVSSHEKCQARALAASHICRVGRCVLTMHFLAPRSVSV